MMWIEAGIALAAGCMLLAYALCLAASPKSAWERRIDEEAQIQALREHNQRAHERLGAFDKLKAKIPGGEV